MTKNKIDIETLAAALDKERTERGLSWRQLAAEIGVTPSLLSRLRNGDKPDADGFATLVNWLGIPAERFIADKKSDTRRKQPELMTELTALLRARKDFEPADIQYLEEIIHATVRRMKAERQGEE
jgi:transcriptional regulator with XRE-family HTH domain